MIHINVFKHRTITRYTLGIALLILGLGIAFTPAYAQTCRPNYVLGAEKVQLPCVDWLSDPTSRTVYQAELLLENADLFVFKWGNKTQLPNPATEVGAIFNANHKELYIPIINVQTAPGITQPYQVTLQEMTGGLLNLTVAKPQPVQSNHRPTATSFSVSLSPADLVTKTYQTIQLKAKDEDNDTLSFELLAPANGTGYPLAYLDPSSHILYVIVDQQFFGSIELPYRVTDGKIFSDPATVKLSIENVAIDSSLKLGSQRIDARDFAGFRPFRAKKRSIPRTGTPGSQATLPTRMDLSDQFPTPRDQGNQNSCVGWALAYVKTYQEALEMGWSLDQNERLFSPAFFYNQVNNRADYGAKIPEALDLLVNKGAATLATMPYSANFGAYLIPPTDAANQEAEKFKAINWGTLRSQEDIKNALANRQPVIVSMAVFDSFRNLKGPNAVYNTPGDYLGDHAVVIVGYDDEYSGGGAYKLINSWGPEWGEQGYFWLPYSFIATPVKIAGQDKGVLFAGAYIVLDNKNTDVTYTPPITEATEALLNLPNLEITDWKIDYDPKQGGQGQLQYTVANTGTQALPANSMIWVDLILSEQPTLSLTDYYNGDYYYVGSEDISEQLASGEAVTRDENSALPFTLESSIPKGEYYWHLLVIGYDEANSGFLEELNEDDNLKSSDKPITLLSSELPNIAVDFWYAEWNEETEEGWLEYAIVNNSDIAIEPEQNWNISLRLFADEDANGNPIEPVEYTLWRETVTDIFWSTDGEIKPENQDYPFALAQQDERGAFTIYQDVDGNPIPAGKYEVIFKMDGGADAVELGLSRVKESDETDNTSFSGTWVFVDSEVEGPVINSPEPDDTETDDTDTDDTDNTDTDNTDTDDTDNTDTDDTDTDNTDTDGTETDGTDTDGTNTDDTDTDDTDTDDTDTDDTDTDNTDTDDTDDDGSDGDGFDDDGFDGDGSDGDGTETDGTETDGTDTDDTDGDDTTETEGSEEETGGGEETAVRRGERRANQSLVKAYNGRGLTHHHGEGHLRRNENNDPQRAFPKTMSDHNKSIFPLKIIHLPPVD